MILTAQNILCHEKLDITIEPGVTIVSGKNSAGKTSIATMIAALAAHHINPKGLPTTQFKSYVKGKALFANASMNGVTWRPALEDH